MKDMVIATRNTMVAVNGSTARRALVIAHRTGDAAMAVIKAGMIDLLKEKLHNGTAHFAYIKASTGELREAWGTCTSSLMGAKINGNGINRDSVNTICYWDIEKGGFRSLRFESLVKVF